MKTKILIAMTLALSLNASASENKSDEPKSDKKVVMKEAFKGGAIGCGIGAVVGKLTGGDMKDACIAAGVSGAIQAGFKEHKRQIKEAKALAEDARRQGMTASVETKSVEVSHEGTSQSTEGLDRLVLDFSNEDFVGNKAKIDRILVKAANLSDKSKTPITITVEGTSAQRAYLIEGLSMNLEQGTRTRLVEGKGKLARLIISPMPD